MNKEIQLEKRNVFGIDRIYPACHVANALIKLKEKKTFNKSDLEVFIAGVYLAMAINKSNFNARYQEQESRRRWV